MNLVLLIIVISLFIFDKTCLWLEKKGYIYYRNKKPTKGIVGSALQELNAILIPSHRHVVAAKEEQVLCKQNKDNLPEDSH